MTNIQQLLYFSGIIIFVTIVFIHLVKKSASIILLYALQSAMLALPFFVLSILQRSALLFFVGIVTFAVKVVLAPNFFFRLMEKHKLVFSSSTYLNTPATLIIITVLTTGANMPFAQPYFRSMGGHENALPLMTAAMFISLFLAINRKGALSQIIGVLCLENTITAAALLTGLEQTGAFQLGILFEILVWIVIAAIFITMLHKHFGSLDVVTLKHLQE